MYMVHKKCHLPNSYYYLIPAVKITLSYLQIKSVKIKNFINPKGKLICLVTVAVN